ncbi:MAG: hypothetical protein GY851_01930, partial [bacterium]|nr:hypothetical protein [bacterium]
GPRATRNWGYARAHGLKTLAKVQANNTWEISSVPYIPALRNVAQHAANLRETDVKGMMLSWTLGGHPSPNLEVFAEMGGIEDCTIDEALLRVAQRLFGDDAAPAVVDAWNGFSAAFLEYPYSGGQLYCAPQQMGPANPLYERPTGYGATMVGLPYDALDAWRAVYPPDIFIQQFDLVADGFDASLATLRDAVAGKKLSANHARALARELDVAEVCTIHFRSVANQAKFVVARNALAAAETSDAAAPHVAVLDAVLRDEIDLATRLHAIQGRDSRIGFEASNHYFYVPMDLGEKVINCQDLLTRWLPAEKKRVGLD